MFLAAVGCLEHSLAENMFMLFDFRLVFCFSVCLEPVALGLRFSAAKK